MKFRRTLSPLVARSPPGEDKDAEEGDERAA